MKTPGAAADTMAVTERGHEAGELDLMVPVELTGALRGTMAFTGSAEAITTGAAIPLSTTLTPARVGSPPAVT